MSKGGRKKTQYVYRYWVGQFFEYFDRERQVAVKGTITKVDSLPDEINDRITIELEGGEGEDIIQIPRSNRQDKNWPGGRKKAAEGTPLKKLSLVADKSLGSTIMIVGEDNQPLYANVRVVDFVFDPNGVMTLKIVDVGRAELAGPIADPTSPKPST